ncbi:MAG: phage tail family protein [Anaerotignum sp.]|nr:phage tail family protein [Anaerotignum sp.]
MIHEAWFKFNGIDSRSLGIRVTKMPETVRAEKRIESLTVPGRSGAIHTDEGAYDSYMRTMECAIIRRDKLDKIAAWLQGSGEIIFSTEPDKIYHVTISNKISIAQMMRTFQKFQVTMDTQPFKYSVSSRQNVMELTEAMNVLNVGTVFSEPTITVYGSGNIILTINDKSFPLYDVDGSITIDSDAMEVYKGTTNQNSKYGSMYFPRLEVGDNSMSWEGTVHKVVIIPKWRWV